MKPFTRENRVAGLIQETLSEILRKKIKDPRLEMTLITTVKMSPDLRLAKIYYTNSGGKQTQEAVNRGLESAIGYMKRVLAQKLGLRYMPELKFYYDSSFDYGARIDKVLKSIQQDDGKHNETSEE